MHYESYIYRSLLLSGRNVCWTSLYALTLTLTLVSCGEYADGTDRQPDRCQTITLCFLLDTASVTIWNGLPVAPYVKFPFIHVVYP